MATAVAPEAQRQSVDPVFNLVTRLRESFPARQPLEANTQSLRAEPRADMQRFCRLRMLRAIIACASITGPHGSCIDNGRLVPQFQRVLCVSN